MTEISERTQRLLDESIIVDVTLPGAPMTLLNQTDEMSDRIMSRFERGGVTWASCTVAADFQSTIAETLALMATSFDWILRRPERFLYATCVDDVLRAKKVGKLAVNFHFQGTNPIQGNLKMLEVYKRLGVSHMLLAYNQKNRVGDGCHERTDGGLSHFGVQLIQEMERVGIVVDLTHTGYRTTMDAIEVATRPVIFSHSIPRVLYDHGRNIWDDQIEGCAKTGGVIGINGVGNFMSDAGDDASPGMLIRQIDHVAQLVGARHIGFGLDYVENVPALVALIAADRSRYQDSSYDTDTYSFASPEAIPEVADGLLARGYSDDDVKGILGENFLRVFREIWG